MPASVNNLGFGQKTESLFAPIGRKLIYRAGRALITPLSMANSAFYLCGGCVRVSIINREGMEAIICYAHQGDLVGAEATISGQPYGITAVAVEDTEAWVLSREQLVAAMKTNPEFVSFIVTFFSSKVREMGRHIMNLTLQDSYGRVAQAILDHSLQKQRLPWKENPNILFMTQSDLASYLGLSRITVTNILKVFQDEGLIEKGKHYILLKDKKGLKRWLK